MSLIEWVGGRGRENRGVTGGSPPVSGYTILLLLANVGFNHFQFGWKWLNFAKLWHLVHWEIMRKCSIFPQMFPFYSQNGYFFPVREKMGFCWKNTIFSHDFSQCTRWRGRLRYHWTFSNPNLDWRDIFTLKSNIHSIDNIEYGRQAYSLFLIIRMFQWRHYSNAFFQDLESNFFCTGFRGGDIFTGSGSWELKSYNMS